MSGKFSGELLKRCVDVRAITLRSATFESRVRISSWTPSAKNALSGSRLRLSKGRTAIDFSGIATGAGDDAVAAGGASDLTIRSREVPENRQRRPPPIASKSARI